MQSGTTIKNLNLTAFSLFIVATLTIIHIYTASKSLCDVAPIEHGLAKLRAPQYQHILFYNIWASNFLGGPVTFQIYRPSGH